METLWRHASDWPDILRLQACGYASVGFLGFVIGFMFGRPIAMIPGILVSAVWLVVVWRRPFDLPQRLPRRVWRRAIYLLVGPLMYALVAAVAVVIAAVIGRHLSAPLGTIVESVMSAFALGAALMFATAKSA